MDDICRRDLLEGPCVPVMSGLLAAGFLATARSARAAPLPDPGTLSHVVRRLGFGISQREWQHAEQIGVAAWVTEQLQPESIDNQALEQQLAAAFPTLALDAPQLAALVESETLTQDQVALELKLATVQRAAYSPRRLYETLVEFWGNHFNVFHGDGPVAVLKTPEDRQVMRVHALGRFRELLHADARSPAMLFYLDNYANSAQGPNENYARELMELHTLGVEGGYQEADVLEVARCFTGWTLGRDQNVGLFQFTPQRHDFGAKTVLGQAIPPGQGIEDGEQVLDLLAGHPSTADHIARKLCIRFVSDTPDPDLVSQVSATFQQTGGDSTAVLQTLFASPVFLASRDAKFKRPLEFIASALAALEADIAPQGWELLSTFIIQMGQVPFDWQPPTGYPDVTAAWASTNGLLYRFNISLLLASNRLPGIEIDYPTLSDHANSAPALVDQLSTRLLHRPLSLAHRDLLIQFASSGGGPAIRRAPGVAGLLLASAYFQNR